MIREAYITFKQAKALRELGFPQLPSVRDDYLFVNSVPYVYEPSGSFSMDRWNEAYYTVVPLSLVQKWLREEKDIELYCIPCMYDDEMKSYEFEIIGRHFARLPYDSYDSALSSGIDKCIDILR